MPSQEDERIIWRKAAQPTSRPIGPIRSIPEFRIYAGLGSIPRKRLEDTGAATLRLAEGESPFGPPPEYKTIRKELEKRGLLAEAGEKYPELYCTKPIPYIRERFGISEEPYVVISGGGSDQILERIFTQLIRDPYPNPVDILGIGPHFPIIVKFASQKGHSYGTISTPLNTTLDDTIEKAINIITRTNEINRKDTVIYLCNPGTPKGDSASKEAIKALADCEVMMVIDEAFGDALEDDESAIKLTQTHPNVIVTRTLSKVIGLAGERIGYAVMSKGIGKKYKELPRPYEVNGPAQLIIGGIETQKPDKEPFRIKGILHPKILLPHLKSVREKIINVKTALLSALEEVGIEVLPTDPRVYILVVDGKHGDFNRQFRWFKTETIPGSGFWITHSGLTDRYARIVTPNNLTEVEELARRIYFASR